MFASITARFPVRKGPDALTRQALDQTNTYPDEQIIRFDRYEVDVCSGELRKEGRKIRLQPQPFRLLVLLLLNAGRIVSRENVRQDLWNRDTFVDFDKGLAAALNKIRKALGDSAESPRYLETIPRRESYRFIAPVSNGNGSKNEIAGEDNLRASPGHQSAVTIPGASDQNETAARARSPLDSVRLTVAGLRFIPAYFARELDPLGAVKSHHNIGRETRRFECARKSNSQRLVISAGWQISPAHIKTTPASSLRLCRLAKRMRSSGLTMSRHGWTVGFPMPQTC